MSNVVLSQWIRIVNGTLESFEERVPCEFEGTFIDLAKSEYTGIEDGESYICVVKFYSFVVH